MFVKWMKAAAAASATLALFVPAAQAKDPTPDDWRNVRAAAANVATELAALCPVAAPGDQRAFDACRKGLYGDSVVRDSLNGIVLWGRQRDPQAALSATNLSQFAPDVLTSMYIPLFMFDGTHTVSYVRQEGLFQIRLATAFRNRLPPGQFPYPFWHEDEKWSMYQNANEVIFWWDPKKSRVKVAQFTVHGPNTPLAAVKPVPSHEFDGRWMWADSDGKSQPKVTLFDGLYRADNPYLGKLDEAYKVFAIRLREGQCDSCHVPNNPDHSKRLVLLQTPAHAAAEMQRLLKAVREDRMPRDDAGIENPLDAKTKKALLEDGEAFAKLVDAAKRWESQSSQARASQQGGGAAYRAPGAAGANALR
jgi:hypothetical protein